MAREQDDIADLLAQTNVQTMANDPIIRQAFSIALLASDLFVPVEQSEAEQDQAGGVSLQATSVNGQPHILLFSSRGKLGAFCGKGTRFARASGLDILSQIQGHFAILNAGPEGRAFAPDDIAQILGKNANPAHGQQGHVHRPNCSHDH